MSRAEAAGVARLLLPAIDSTTHSEMLTVEKEYPQCVAMMGLHPCSVTAAYENELSIIQDYLQQRKFIAIGEIGLDFYWDKTFTEQQYSAFRAQIRMAVAEDLPIVIHSRNATDECIEVVREFKEVRGVFHCFSGNYDQARAIMELGFYLGIGGVVSFKNAGLDKVVERTGLDRVILETDAPYLAPVPYRGKRNEPAYTRLVAEKLVQITGMDLEKIAEITTANSRSLFNLDS
jgi:TatD DNase family protein